MFENTQQLPKDINGTFVGKPVKRSVTQFVYLMSGVLAVIFVFSFYRNGFTLFNLCSLLIAGGILYFGLKEPKKVFPLWVLWMKLGLILNKIVSPVVLFLMWWCVVVPVSLLVKALKIKVIDTSYRPDEDVSYWIDRKDKENDFSLLTKQF